MTKARTTFRQAQSGLTLIEMLIVLVIIGVAATAAVLSVNMAGRERRTEDEALRLAARLTMAVDEGLVSGQRLALFWSADGYEVKRWSNDGWQIAATPLLAQPHRLPGSVVMRRMDGSEAPVAVGEDGLGPAVSLEISGPGKPWVVAFDGYSAAVQPGAAP